MSINNYLSLKLQNFLQKNTKTCLHVLKSTPDYTKYI